MDDADGSMQYNRLKLQSLFQWKAPDEMSKVEELLQGAGPQMYIVFHQYSMQYGVTGWSVMYDALWDYSERNNLPTDSVEKDVQAWFEVNISPGEGIEGTSAEWFAKQDEHFKTDYFSTRLTYVVCLFHNDPTLLSTVNEAIDRFGSQFRSFVATKQQHYDLLRSDTRDWLTQFYGRHAPAKINTLDDLIAPGKSFSTVIRQEELKLTLMKKYEPMEYLKFATWSSQYPDNTIREAAIEYFVVDLERKENLNFLDQILERGALKLVEEIFATYEKDDTTGWNTIAIQKSQQGFPILFPPWRDPDYPAAHYPAWAVPREVAFEPGAIAVQQEPHPLPYKIPRLYLAEIERSHPLPAAAPGPQPGAPASPPARGGKPSEPSGFPVDDNSSADDRPYQNEVLTDEDMDPLKVKPKTGDRPAEASRWKKLLDDIKQHTTSLPVDLNQDAGLSDGAAANPAEKEGWLCFHEDPRGLVIVDSALGSAIDPLCNDCSLRVIRSKKAVWAPVDRHAVASTQTDVVMHMKEGQLQIISDKTFLKPGKWTTRFVRATDTGLHYYSSNDEQKLKKAKGSRLFDKGTEFIRAPDPHRHDLKAERVDEAGFHYFGFQLRNPKELLWLRTPEKAAAEDWRSWFDRALQRFKQYDDGQDPNPAKWKARVKGLLGKLDDTKTAAEAAAAEADRAKQQRAQMEELRSRAEADRDWAQLQASTAEERAASLHDEARKAEMECVGLKKEIETLRADAAAIRQQTELMRQRAVQNSSTADTSLESSAQTLEQLEAQLAKAQAERDEAQQETLAIFAKWRRCEERSPGVATERARTRTGLSYVPRTKPSSPGFPGL
ncbi:hypothetical protein DIPPA_16517 [Diplonema papillatum]|nr:hypothetical protein DIPPA_16517 [Diplonema papillatum]